MFIGATAKKTCREGWGLWEGAVATARKFQESGMANGLEGARLSSAPCWTVGAPRLCLMIDSLDSQQRSFN